MQICLGMGDRRTRSASPVADRDASSQAPPRLGMQADLTLCLPLHQIMKATRRCNFLCRNICSCSFRRQVLQSSWTKPLNSTEACSYQFEVLTLRCGFGYHAFLATDIYTRHSSACFVALPKRSLEWVLPRRYLSCRWKKPLQALTILIRKREPLAHRPGILSLGTFAKAQCRSSGWGSEVKDGTPQYTKPSQ